MIPETNNFRERVTVVIGGTNATNFADCGHWAFGLDDQPDQLDDAAARFRDASGAHALER